MNDKKKIQESEKQVITVEEISNEDLETVDGGRYYGWGGGGWNTEHISGSGFSDWSSNYAW